MLTINLELTSAMQELSGLEALEYQMARNLSALREQQREAYWSQTLTGTFFNYGGFLFALYCVYRIIVVRLTNLVSLTWPSSPMFFLGCRQPHHPEVSSILNGSKRQQSDRHDHDLARIPLLINAGGACGL